ncbi:MAG: hypothetical protein KF753_19255 [Caldilineaceae bacterium]|nr:hypothetical protein [Caldilineaceae bacterium]
MTRLIRNYQSGSQIVLSDHLRRYMSEGGEAQIDDAELARRLRLQAEEMVSEASSALADARREADALRQEAESTILVAQAEAQAAGYAEGYQQGIAEGQAVGEGMLVSGIEEVQTLLAAVQQQRSHLLLQAEHEVATLAMAIAEKVLGGLAHTQREMIVQTVNRALNELVITGPFSLRVHPDDAAYLEDTWKVPAHNGETPAWKLLPDEAIGRGGAVLTCGPATVDARLSSQLKSIVTGLALSDYRLDDEADEVDEVEFDAPGTDAPVADVPKGEVTHL